MFQNYFRMAVVASLATYLLSLAAGVYNKPLFDHMFSEPLEMLKKQREFAEIARNDRFVWFHQMARDDKKGVVVSDPSKTWGEYTFFTSAWSPRVQLIDLKGAVVHEWTIDWQKIWANAADRRPEVSPLHNIVSRAFLQPNGDVIAEFTGEGGQLGDYGMVRVDKDSKVIWKYNQFANHDVAVLPTGNILTFIEEIRRTPHPAVPFLKPPFLEPYLAMVDKNGNEVNRVSFFDMFADSPQKKFLANLDKILPSQPANGDIFHPNTITPVTAEAAARNPVFKEGQLMLSLRNFNMLAVLDLDTNKITWASYGPWRGQHSPEFIADGSLVMFDNLGNMRDKGGLSRVLNVDPVSGKILWEYDGTDQDRFYSSYNSAIDALPNGNVLVTETSAGRIFEVTRDKEVVWDYRAPERVFMQGENRIPSLFSGRRFRREDLPFLDSLPPKTP